jgi:hypothetical protein
MKIVINPAERVESKNPPVIFRPKLPSDLAGFSSIDDLIRREGDPKTHFPFQRELALYLLLLASLWPGDTNRLLVAARIFSGALNFRVSGSGKRSKLMKPLDGAYSASNLVL